MDLNKNVFTILAIFLLVVTAGAVSAANNASALSNSDGNIISVDGNTDVNVDDVVDVNATGTNTTDVKVADNVTCNTTGNITGNTTTNTTGNATQNVTNTTGNATAPMNTLQNLVTGNPILALLAVSAVLGGYTIIRKD